MASTIDEIYMQEALKEARAALKEDEVPVGAVIVHKRRIIARAHNQMVRLHDPTAHAEMIAITQAANALNNERLLDTAIYVTIEPCVMCAGAMVLARIKRLVYGAPDKKAGACGSVLNVPRTRALNHHFEVRGHVLGDEAVALLRAFFHKKRKMKRHAER